MVGWGGIGKEREMISLQNEKRRRVQIGLITEKDDYTYFRFLYF